MIGTPRAIDRRNAASVFSGTPSLKPRWATMVTDSAEPRPPARRAGKSCRHQPRAGHPPASSPSSAPEGPHARRGGRRGSAGIVSRALPHRRADLSDWRSSCASSDCQTAVVIVTSTGLILAEPAMCRSHHRSMMPDAARSAISASDEYAAVGDVVDGSHNAASIMSRTNSPVAFRRARSTGGGGPSSRPWILAATSDWPTWPCIRPMPQDAPRPQP